MNRPEAEIGKDRQQERQFRRGNINFDFLTPDEELTTTARERPSVERRSGEREGKRGLFNRGRQSNPVTLWHQVLWALVFLAAACAIVTGLMFFRNAILLLVTPFLLTAGLFSLIMLALFAARPR